MTAAHWTVSEWSLDPLNNLWCFKIWSEKLSSSQPQLPIKRVKGCPKIARGWTALFKKQFFSIILYWLLINFMVTVQAKHLPSLSSLQLIKNIPELKTNQLITMEGPPVHVTPVTSKALALVLTQTPTQTNLITVKASEHNLSCIGKKSCSFATWL